MKMIASNCIVFDKTSMKTKFTDNVSDETILVALTPINPYVSYSIDQYNYSNTTEFSICGPLMLMMKELAILKNRW